MGRLVLIPRDLTAAERRTRIAHALGHHFLHVGNQLWLRGLDRLWNGKLERQAEEFAAYLTIPVSDEPYLLGSSVGDVATKYRVTEGLVRRRSQGIRCLKYPPSGSFS